MLTDRGTITELALQGVWKRDWIESKAGRDDSTQVLWAQAGELFVDIRIPKERPDIRSIPSLSALSESERRQLTKAEGFAGHIELHESVCTWHREINWRGPTTDIDAGALYFTADGALMEVGTLANYSERWQPFIAPPLHARRFTSGDLTGVLILSKKHYFFGVGVPLPGSQLPASTPMTNTQVTDPFASEYSFGHWDDNVGIAELHTNPFCENKRLLTRNKDRFIWHRLDDGGKTYRLELNCH